MVLSRFPVRMTETAAQGLAAHRIGTPAVETPHPVKVHRTPPRVRLDLVRDPEPSALTPRRALPLREQLLMHRTGRRVMNAPLPRLRPG